MKCSVAFFLRTWANLPHFLNGADSLDSQSVPTEKSHG